MIGEFFGETHRWIIAGSVYYIAAFIGFLVYRLGFSRPREEDNRPSRAEEDNIIVFFTHGMNPLLAALLFPLFFPFLLFFQYILMRTARRHLPENRMEMTQTSLSPNDKESLAGSWGESINDLHPSGTIRVGNRNHEAVAENGFIPRGRKVDLIRREGFYYLVRESGESAEEIPGKS